jgi:regulator of replication initiation timing
MSKESYYRDQLASALERLRKAKANLNERNLALVQENDKLRSVLEEIDFLIESPLNVDVIRGLIKGVTSERDN